MNTQHARNMVIMIAAGGALPEVLAKCQELQIHAAHIQALTVPAEEQAAQSLLSRALGEVSEGR